MQNIFSYPILIDDLNANEKKYKISAEPEHLPYLTEVLKVPGVNMLSAEFVLKNNKKEHLLKVRG